MLLQTIVPEACPASAEYVSTAPTPTADYSSYFTAGFANGNSIVQPLTKSTNKRGDDVYTGITRNPSGSYTMTTVVELTQSQAEAKQTLSCVSRDILL
jgi:hypothetical protein